MKNKRIQRLLRHARVRQKNQGTSHILRLAVFRSNKRIYAQLIDDTRGQTVAAASSLKIAAGSKIAKAKAVGGEIAKVAIKKNIKKAVFDRGGFAYHGRVKALADGAREGGLTI